MDTIYYYETPNRHGRITAANDDEALAKKPSNCIVLYKENDTEDGTPFIIIYEK